MFYKLVVWSNVDVSHAAPVYPHLFLLLQPGGLLLQHGQLLLGEPQLLAGALKRSGQLVVGHLQLDVLHVALLLLAAQLMALELQLGRETFTGVRADAGSGFKSPPLETCWGNGGKVQTLRIK